MRFPVSSLLILSVVGCSRFVWSEEPFTPDPAPVSEIIASGNDTTYVLRGSAYYLLTPQRAALWNRDVMDEVAWRYRALFGEAPRLVAVRLASRDAGRDSTTWRGVPFAVVSVQRRDERQRNNDQAPSERAMDDSVAVRVFARPVLAATAAELWLAARATDAAGDADSEPGGSSRAAAATAGLPAWFEAAVLRLLASPGATDRAVAEVRANSKGVVPLTTLFTVRWPARPNAGEVVGVVRDVLGPHGAVMMGTVERPSRERASVPGVSPLFISQAVSVLAFIREADPSLVARLADELARRRTVRDVLASGTALPRDIAAFEAEWTKWVKRTGKRR